VSLLEVNVKKTYGIERERERRTIMKPNATFAHIAFILLSLLALASAGFGATDPLAHPWGLAVDAKGNLYVANTYGYNILVFTPGYAAKKTLTITKGVSAPSGVAFDPLGNLWVANAGPGNGSNDGSITEWHCASGSHCHRRTRRHLRGE
jgi:DNA-binding beta-propeller fold protein YncE